MFEVLKTKGKTTVVRRTRMSNQRKRRLAFEEIRQRVEKLKARDQIRLHHIFDDEQIHQMCETLHIEFR
ncbi:MAG: hypothetical protein NTX48_22450, partial [Planctomycetales bacterium]|nr:hypothetical protein [Planctomycetales bacterium]